MSYKLTFRLPTAHKARRLRCQQKVTPLARGFWKGSLYLRQGSPISPFSWPSLHLIYSRKARRNKERNNFNFVCSTREFTVSRSHSYIRYKQVQKRHLTAVKWPLKADSHTACRAHAAPLPCRVAKSPEYIFPIWFTQCGRVWFTLAMPRPCHALTMPFFSRPRHSTDVERRPVGYLPAFGFFRLPRGVPRRLLSEAY
jgi:hypothetical protein